MMRTASGQWLILAGNSHADTRSVQPRSRDQYVSRGVVIGGEVHPRICIVVPRRCAAS